VGGGVLRASGGVASSSRLFPPPTPDAESEDVEIIIELFIMFSVPGRARRVFRSSESPQEEHRVNHEINRAARNYARQCVDDATRRSRNYLGRFAVVF